MRDPVETISASAYGLKAISDWFDFELWLPGPFTALPSDFTQDFNSMQVNHVYHMDLWKVLRSAEIMSHKNVHCACRPKG